jgi:hypothetical protein
MYLCRENSVKKDLGESEAEYPDNYLEKILNNILHSPFFSFFL